jgi:hypothetical protein
MTIQMDSYDPDVSPTAADWLKTGEGERIERVASYHRRKQIKLPNSQLHAAIHVVLENQIALGEEIVLKTLTRLQREGLGRHDALHAMGSVLAEDLYTLMQEGDQSSSDTYQRYLERLQTLTAKNWRAG